MSMRYPAGFISAFYNPLKNPDAPTIGTATGGNASASVTFTAPANVGGSAITSYTVVSSPTGITGTGASSPVTVSGLSNGTAYTFKVFATNSYGPSVLSAASNSVTPSNVPVVGSAYGGGFFAGQISTAGNGVADYNLVVAPVSSGQFRGQWKTANNNTPGTLSEIDGPANTAAIVADGNSTTYPCGHFCNNLVTGGQTDWYMPALNELEICYYNLKPTTQVNNTGGGINPNSVPARASTYTSGTPAQTSAADFKDTGSEDFTAGGDYYWTSTQNSGSAGYVRIQFFNNGYQANSPKSSNYFVRAVRRVAV